MERLRAAGLEPAVGHDAANLPEGAEVVVSTAIGADNPELALARERGIEPIHRGALLAELCAEKRLIAVAGTHGKTTTTAMAGLGVARRSALTRPSSSAARCPGLGPEARANAGWGEGEWVVAEADESDASFLELKPEIAVVTNVEMDHHSRWGSLAELRSAFRQLFAEADGVVLPADGGLDDLGRAAGSLSSTSIAPGPADLAAGAFPGATTGMPAPRLPRSSSPDPEPSQR